MTSTPPTFVGPNGVRGQGSWVKGTFVMLEVLNRLGICILSVHPLTLTVPNPPI